LSGTVNRVILVGRLGRDPEIKYAPSGMAMASFSLATDETRKDAQGNRTQQTEWHNVVLWGKQAEIAGEYLKKGSLIYLEGRLQTRTWDDASGGGKRQRMEVVGNRFVMLGARPDSAEGAESNRTSGGVQTPAETPSRLEDEEDLPF
jgi:single-strand DNA-binding protein